MAISTIKATFHNDIHKVWKAVTSVENYTWRSDLSKTEILNEKQFIEYTKKGYVTTFTVTVLDPYKRWEFDMENENMKGHWSGVFTEKEGQTEVEFTEEVVAKNIFVSLFIKLYIKKQQTRFISDLQKVLL